MSYGNSSYIEHISDEDDGNSHTQLEMRRMWIANRQKHNFILVTTDPDQDQGLTRYYSSDGRNSSWSDDPIHAYRMDQQTAQRMAGYFNAPAQESDRVSCEIKRLQIQVVSAGDEGADDE